MRFRLSSALKETSRQSNKLQLRLGGGLDESAAATIRTWKYEPARRDGVPVAAKVLVKVTFKLLR